MDINALTNELNSIRNEEQRLNEQINQLETERLKKEELQSITGPITIEKSEEQVRLEERRNSLVVNKNKINNIIASYRQMSLIASNSEYKGYSIKNFEELRNKFDTRRKELGNMIQVLETARLKKEELQSITGPITIEKSEEQKKLEKEKLEAEQAFQKNVNIIILYNRINEELNKLKEEKDLNKYLTKYGTLIYQANKAGLPEQLMVNLMNNKIEVKENLDNKFINPVSEKEKSNSNSNSNSNLKSDPDNQEEIKKEEKKEIIVSSKSREEEIKDLIRDSAVRMRKAKEEGNDVEYIKERSIFSSLTKELNEIKEEKARKFREEEIKKEEALLENSKKRLQEAKDNNNQDAYAYEMNYRQAILEKINELNNKIKKNSDSTSVINYGNSNINQKKEEENEVIEEKKEELSEEEIREKIIELQSKRKEIDDEIIKIDINAPWGNTYELMGQYIKVSQEINRLKSMLPKEDIKKENKKQENKRKPRFRRFLSTIKVGVRNALYGIKRLGSKIFEKDKDMEVDIDIDSLKPETEEYIRKLEEINKEKETLSKGMSR